MDARAMPAAGRGMSGRSGTLVVEHIDVLELLRPCRVRFNDFVHIGEIECVLT